jgi:hypothetical protein
MNYLKAVGTVLAVILITSSANAGLVGKAVDLAENYAPRILKFWPKQTGEKAAKELAERIAPEGTPLAARLVSKMSGKSKTEIAELSSWWKQAEDGLRGIPATEREQAVDFLLRTKREGALVIKRFRWEKVVAYGLTKPDAEPVVNEAGKLIDAGLGGSWVGLRVALAKAASSITKRDFAEKIFLDRAIAKRIPGLEHVKLWEGQHNAFNGIDFIGLAPGQKIKVIEFSTGIKPVDGAQMSWPWISESMKKFVRSVPEEKDSLRAAGFPNEWLLDPERITETSVRLRVEREFYAVGRDDRLLRRLENDGPVKFNCLEPYRGCKAA